MDQVEEVKSKLDIVEVISSYMSLKRGGKNWKGLCPFHGEKSPSFMVNSELQIYKCFGCGEAGDAISFVQKMEGLDFVEALKMLAEKVGVEIKFKVDEKKSEREEMEAIHELAAEYYHYLLTQHSIGKGALEYLKTRKVGEKLIKEFKIGFALNSWDGLFEYLVNKKKKDAKLVERSGLIVESEKHKGRFYDRFRNRVMFPLLDHRGKVVGFAGRIMPGDKDEKETPKYINSPETLIYHKSEILFGLSQARKAIREKDRVVVVEGEVDMISSYGAGLGETVAIKGSALTEQQVERLRRLTNNLVLSLDADMAGDAATKRGIQIAENKGMSIKVVRIAGGKDPDDIARENPNGWKKMVDKAIDIYQFYLDSAVAKHDKETIEGKRKISEEVVPILVGINNKVVQSFYIKKLAEILGVNEDGVVKEVERYAKIGKHSLLIPVEEKKKGESENREDLLEKEILGLLLNGSYELAMKLGKKFVEISKGEVEGKIIEKWLEKRMEAVELIKLLPQELKVLAEEAYVKEVNEASLERDLESAVNELERLRLKEKRRLIGEEIEKAEKEGDLERLSKLQESFVSLSRRLKS